MDFDTFVSSVTPARTGCYKTDAARASAALREEWLFRFGDYSRFPDVPCGASCPREYMESPATRQAWRALYAAQCAAR